MKKGAVSPDAQWMTGWKRSASLDKKPFNDQVRPREHFSKALDVQTDAKGLKILKTDDFL